MGESHILWTETEEGQMLDSEGMTAGPSLLIKEAPTMPCTIWFQDSISP